MTIKPPALKQGDLIGIMAPSSSAEASELAAGSQIAGRQRL